MYNKCHTNLTENGLKGPVLAGSDKDNAANIKDVAIQLPQHWNYSPWYGLWYLV